MGGNKDYWEYTFPLSMSEAFAATLVRHSGSYVYTAKITELAGTYLHWTDTDGTNNHGQGDPMYCIIIGAL